MALFNPIVSDRKLRRFGVLDLEWVPGEALPALVNTEVDVEGLSEPLRIPMPVAKRMTSPLQLRMAGYYDQRAEDMDDMDGDAEPEMIERYQSFGSIRDLVTFLLSREHRGNWFFAHAGGLADMQFVLDDLLTEIKRRVGVEGSLERSSTVYDPTGKKQQEETDVGSWKIKASFSGSSAIIVHVIKGKNAWHFCDSYWLLRDKLANIGKAIGIRKGDTPEAIVWMTERFGREVKDFDTLSQAEKTIFYGEVPQDILIAYNRIDCEILWKAIAAFETEIVGLGGQLQQTIASTAMTLFRRAYLKRDIFTSERLNQLCQESYFASRVEVLSRKAEDFFIYDINSSFPNAMTYPLPGNFISYQTTLPDDQSDECIYLANVTIEIPDMHLPPLPYRKDNRVFFPVGRWRSWFTSTDIRLALREGATLHKVHEVYLFEPFYDFGNYAKEIYKLRSDATTDFRRLVLKYLLNSLYGKTAESVMKQEMLVNPKEIDRTKMQMLQPGVWLSEEEAKITHRHVVVASVITAIARRTLYDYAKECYNQKHALYYCDSISADRTVVLRSPKGEIIIEPIEEVWNQRGKDVRQWGPKETCNLGAGWTALAKDSHGKEGWYPLKKVIRHQTSKEMFLISSKRGQAKVTQDHSLVIDGQEVKPQDFVDNELQFETLAAPQGRDEAVIDLLEHVEGFHRVIETDACHGGRIDHHFELDKSGDWVTLTNFRKPTMYVRRYYERGSPHFRALLRVLAAFIAEGSSSLRGVTTDTRDMFSLCQQDEGWLSALHTDLLSITKGVEFTGPKWSEGSGIYYLRSGTGLMAAFFGMLGGIRGSQGRRLPSFIYNLSTPDFHVFWDKLVEGDGSKDEANRDRYVSISQQLVAGLSFALSQHGYEHLIQYRPSKGSYTLRLRPAGSERKGRKTHVEKSVSGGYVYDLEVEGAHTFVDGLGRVLLHNTDSLATKANLPVDDKQLGALKLEKKMDWAEFVAPKIYRGEGFELKRDGTWEAKQLNKAKGFSLGSGAQAFEKLDRIISGDRVGVQRMTRIRELYRTMVGGQYTTAPFELLVIKALTFEMLSKRFHYPDGETRPWSVAELRSGDVYPKGFDFEKEISERFDFVTRAMLAAAV